MVKRISRRFVSLLLTFVTILAMLPAMTLPALAATKGTVTGLADKNIGLSFDGTADNAWSASSTQIIGKARSTSGSGCGGGKDYSSTLTITNNKTTEATLSFDYTVVVSDGTILVNYTTTTADGSFSQKLAAGGTVEVEIKDSYRNMLEKIKPHFHLVENARKAIEKAGLTPEEVPVRGGTDGATLSWKGLPCPNLGTGGFNFHGVCECTTVERMDKATEILLNIVEIYSK